MAHVVQHSRGQTLVTRSRNKGDDDVAKNRHHLCRTPLSDATRILAQRYIAAPVQAVLDPPVVAIQPQQSFRSGRVAREARDPVRHLDRHPRTCPSLTYNPKHLKATRPVACKVVGQPGRGGQRPFLDPTMPFVDVARLLVTRAMKLSLQGGKDRRAVR